MNKDKRRPNRETLKAFTERATEAVDLNKMIPPIVYLPRKLRAHQTFLTEDDLKVSITPPDIAGNHIRIAKADPLGFLFAMMNGQPIPSFVIVDRSEEDGAPVGDPVIAVEYEVAPLETRLHIAEWLATRITYRPYQSDIKKRNGPEAARMHKHNDDYNAMIAQRANADGTMEENNGTMDEPPGNLEENTPTSLDDSGDT